MEKCKKILKNNDIDKKNQDKIANLTSIHSIDEKNSFIKTTFKSHDEEKYEITLAV